MRILLVSATLWTCFLPLQSMSITESFISAILHKDLEKFCSLIPQITLDAPINENCETALHTAVNANNITMVAILLQKNASIDVRDKKGNTPVHYATVLGHNDILTFLLEKNKESADYYNDNGLMPLHVASFFGHIEIVKILLKYTINYDSSSNSGQTPLYLAADQNHLKIVKFLIENGANATHADLDGNTPLHAAAAKGFDEVVEELLPHSEVNSINKKKLTALNKTTQKSTREKLINAGAQKKANTTREFLIPTSHFSLLKNYCTPLIIAASSVALIGIISYCATQYNNLNKITIYTGPKIIKDWLFSSAEKTVQFSENTKNTILTK